MKRLNIQEIEEIVAKYFNVSPSPLHLRCRRNEIVIPRMITMFLAHKYTFLSTVELGRYYGRHHTTVIYALKEMEDRFIDDRIFRAKLKSIESVILEDRKLEEIL